MMCHVKKTLCSFSADAGLPSSVDFVRCESNQMVAGYTSSNAHIFDIETSQKVLTLESKIEGE